MRKNHCPELAGISVRFTQESLSGLARNHCPLWARICKIESAIKMFWRAISQGVKVDYVLMDSWFTCEAFIRMVRKVKSQTVHLIGMYKIAKTKFNF